MSIQPLITKVEVQRFTWELQGHGRSPGGIEIYDPESTATRSGTALKIFTNVGVVGEYVQERGDPENIANTARRLIGRNALDREQFYDELRFSHAYPWLDIALWDLAGKLADMPIYRLLGGYRTKLPAYASPINGAKSGPLSDPESFADFAEQCHELGYRGFKIHPYPWESVQLHIDTVTAVGKRVGGKMDLMLDPYSCLKTFGDALKVGWACDEYDYFWLEDPYADGGVTPFGHNKLRELIKTPLLEGEHVRGLEKRFAFVTANATDFVRGDVRIDGITGTMKLAHAAEAVALDIEIHCPGPAERHAMSAIRNSNYYEVSWVHPNIPNYDAPIYAAGYEGGLYSIDENGYVDVPQGSGLGVIFDWDFINSHSQGKVEVKDLG
jgi:L-alanine-DL-glutamate epimerase-like enolase superfamily enzyme